ncbi:hypothetical protein [Myxococcus landrumensis]|uniref:Lipoprotein n=1 Tax=Myxococcus landrumensis TaxID=2813577 RepID=A0ABX7ND07_9BACT|nr:hypothetical protein [Myxococcus landrumus]QSQ14198.1 hypothetical protein JY572_38815 [Myxococcus landrumus]
MPIPANPQLPMLNSNSLQTTVINESPNTLSVVISVPDSTQIIALSNATLPPPGTNQNQVTVTTQYNDDNSLNVSVWDPTYSTSNSVASFVSHQKDQDSIIGKGTEPWVDTINYIGGYVLSVNRVMQLGKISVTVSKS